MIQDFMIDTDVFHFIFAKNNLENPTKIKLLSNALQYTTYYLKTNKQRFIAKIFEKNFTETKGPFYLEVMNKLNSFHIDFSKVFLVDYVNGKLVIIFHYVEGRVVFSWNQTQSYLVGKNLAHLHARTVNFKPSCYSESFIEQINLLYARVSTYLSDDFRLIHSEVEYLNTINFTLPKGIIHGDPYDNHVIFQNSGSVTLFDNVLMNHDFFLFDICHIFKKYYFDKGQKEPLSAFKAFINGYQTYRKITDMEKQAMPIILRARLAFSILYLFDSSLKLSQNPDIFIDTCYANYLKLKDARCIKKIDI